MGGRLAVLMPWIAAVFAIPVLVGSIVPSAHAQVPASRATLPFDPLPYEALNKGERKVFGHYFTQFPLSLDNKESERDYYARNYLDPYGEDSKFLEQGGFLRQRPLPRPVRSSADWARRDMRQEVRLAKSIGLDGFALNLLNYEGAHWERALTLLEAAQIEGDGFSILLMPDMNAALRRDPGRFVQMIVDLSEYPAAMRLDDGRLVIAPYMAHLQTPRWWSDQLAELRERGIEVAFVPVFHGWLRRYAGYIRLSHGVSDWGPRNPSAAGRWAKMADKAHRAGLIWMAPVAPQDVRPKNGVYWEAGNSEMFRNQWEAAIDGGADWVHLVTWNDYSEHSVIAPSTSTNYAFHDLTAYYVTWFKTGRRPRITRDAIYSFHRTHSTGAMPDPRLQSTPMKPASSSDMPQNQVEMLAFLTAPAALEISLAGRTHRITAEAGMTSFKIPLQPGKPLFRVIRDGQTVSSLWGAEISDDITVQDLLYHGKSSLRGNNPAASPDPPPLPAGRKSHPVISTTD